jgi:peptidoglycan/LPS O-acetylase OafA/YrhL
MIQNLFPQLLKASAILVVTWSLAIEEQFYLLWPLIIRYTSRRVILPSLVIGLILMPLFRIWAMDRGIAQIAIYMNPLTHGDGLLCGAAVAIWLRSASPRRTTLLSAGVILLGVGLGLFLLLRPFGITSQYCSPLVFTSVALLSTGLLLVALVSEKTGRFLHRFFFMNRTLAFLGFISYGLYLYHFFIVQTGTSEGLVTRLDRWHRPYLTHALISLFALGLSVMIAWVSRVTVERAALARKGVFG